MKHLVAFSCVEGFSMAIVSASVHVRESNREKALLISVAQVV